MRGLLVLIGAALIVGLGVVALAGLILPEAATTEPAEAAPPGPQTETEVDDTAANDPSDPLDQVGGVIEASGDRSGSIEFEALGSASFSSDIRFELESSSSSRLLFGEDENGMLFIDQAVYDGLNLFLDPGDCDLTEQKRNEDSGLVRLDITCADISDVQGNNAVTLEGHIDVPLTIGVAGDEYDSGGTLKLSGEMEAEIGIPTATWQDYPDDFECAGCEPGSFEDSFSLTNLYESSGPGARVHFNVEEDPPQVGLVTYQPDLEADQAFEFLASPDDCVIEQTLVGRAAPDIELLEMTIECPELTTRDNEIEISMAGTLRVHKVVTGPFIIP